MMKSFELLHNTANNLKCFFFLFFQSIDEEKKNVFRSIELFAVSQIANRLEGNVRN